MKEKAPVRQDKPAVKKLRPRPNLTWTAKNYILLAAGLVLVAAGFWRLAAGSITDAPILLVVGYCVAIPLAIVLK